MTQETNIQPDPDLSGVYVVMPAFNEGAMIAQVIEDTLNIVEHIIVVDDGSNDDTFAQASKTKALVLRHCVNRGQGAALQTGVEFALEEGATEIVTLDSDGQHPAELIPEAVQILREQGLDILIGSRFLKPQAVPFTRKIILKLAILFTNFTAGIRLTDTHNGFRILSRAAAEKLKIQQDRMSHASEILEWIAQAKLKYQEIPTEIKYTEYSMSKGQSNWGSVRILLDLFFSRFDN